MSIIVTILLLVLFFKITGFVLKICGAILGAVLSLIGYLILGSLLVTGFGLALIFIPIIMVVGVFSIIGALASL